jgi:hypothetical protein
MPIISPSVGGLSAAQAENWAVIGIACAIFFGIVLVAGLCGEYPESDIWKKGRLYKAAKWAVIIGVFGELVGDATIFAASDRLQQITDESCAGAWHTMRQGSPFKEPGAMRRGLLPSHFICLM